MTERLPPIVRLKQSTAGNKPASIQPAVDVLFITKRSAKKRFTDRDIQSIAMTALVATLPNVDNYL